MDKKQISLISKMFNLLYDVESKYNLFKEQKDYIEEFMLINGYEMIQKEINIIKNLKKNG